MRLQVPPRRCAPNRSDSKLILVSTHHLWNFYHIWKLRSRILFIAVSVAIMSMVVTVSHAMYLSCIVHGDTTDGISLETGTGGVYAQMGCRIYCSNDGTSSCPVALTACWTLTQYDNYSDGNNPCTYTDYNATAYTWWGPTSLNCNFYLPSTTTFRYFATYLPTPPAGGEGYYHLYFPLTDQSSHPTETCTGFTLLGGSMDLEVYQSIGMGLGRPSGLPLRP